MGISNKLEASSARRYGLDLSMKKANATSPQNHLKMNKLPVCPKTRPFL